jgi:hypothetical protein
MARKLAGSLQLLIEYHPSPPFDSGVPANADASRLRLAFTLLLGTGRYAWPRG